MKPPLKPLLAVLIAGLVVALAFFGWSAKAKDDAAFHLANGVEVTPLEVKPDDVATLLDVKEWKFDVVLPDRTKGYFYRLYLSRYGRVAAQLGGVGFGPAPDGHNPPNAQVVVGMVPLGDIFNKASQVRYSIRKYDGNVSGTFANPFSSGLSYTETPEVASSDNMIYLMSGSKNGILGGASGNAVSIALKIEPITTKH